MKLLDQENYVLIPALREAEVKLCRLYKNGTLKTARASVAIALQSLTVAHKTHFWLVSVSAIHSAKSSVLVHY